MTMEITNEIIETSPEVIIDGGNIIEQPEEIILEHEVKDEPNEKELIIQDCSMDGMIEIPEINRLKEVQRRRSLRAEQASGLKKKPPKYDEIFNCYKRKEYKECVIYIDLVSESGKDCIEYQVLKATCLAHIGGAKLPEAHRILDELLSKQKSDNIYCIYAKGVALFQESRWTECIDYFAKAVAIDAKSMQRAEVLMKLAQENLENEEGETEEDGETSSSNYGNEIDGVSEENVNMEVENEDHEKSQDSDEFNLINKRFCCELCDKYFCKKFNLDRHNKTFHNRETPPIAPLPRNRNSLPAASENVSVRIKKEKAVVIPMGEEEKEEEEEEEEVEESESGSQKAAPKSRLKIKIKGRNSISKSTRMTGNRNNMAKCNICKKVYTKGSLARHQIIHTGEKQFKCEECNKAFYQKSDLERHVTIHSDVFDFECEECDKKFRIKKNLQVHIKRHHTN